MSRRLAVLVSFVILLVCISGLKLFEIAEAQTSPASISGKFYKFDLVAQQGQNGINGLSNLISINDSGTVAFTGHSASVPSGFLQQIFSHKINGQVTAITTPTLPDGTDWRAFGSIQINNSEQIIAKHQRRKTGEFGGFAQEVRRWDGNAFESGVLIADGDTDSNSSASFFTILDATSQNNSGQAVMFAGEHTTGNTVLAVGAKPNFSTAIVNDFNSQAKPMIADNGSVVVKGDAFAATPLRLYSQNLSTITDIATVSTTTFSSLGFAPGISDDGSVVAFYGESSPILGQSNSWNSGPGIFISVANGPSRTLVKVAGNRYELQGGNNNHICDTGEACRGELGLTISNAPIYLSSFDSNSRVGIIHQELGVPGILDDTYIIAFIGTPNMSSEYPTGYFSNQRGIWTVRLDFVPNGTGGVNAQLSRPIPVIQINDHLGSAIVSQIGTLTDPIAKVVKNAQGAPRSEARGDHQLAFQVNSSVYRATQTDTDQDGLYDHWESSGIDFNNDGGTPDLVLDGADVNRKDIYVEIDYMVQENMEHEVKFSHRPDYKPNGDANSVSAISQVVTAFANAPVTDPIGNGIALHAIVDEELRVPEYLYTLLLSRGPLANDDFYDFKSGSNATPTGSSCGTTATDGHFGTRSDRMSSNCQNILGARYLAFRYAIFGNALSEDRGNTGRAEFQGNDLFVALGRGQTAQGVNYNTRGLIRWLADGYNALGQNTSFDVEWAAAQADVFMHELGHTLGLKHGGDVSVNCKPNYLSIMSYSRQLDLGGLAVGFPRSVKIADGDRIRLGSTLDFSRASLPNLDETSLDERIGISGPTNQRTLFGRNALAYVSPANGAINWNGGNITSTPISQDVNYIPQTCTADPASPGQTLTGFNDWTNITYNYRNTRIKFDDGNNPVFEDNVPEFDSTKILDAAFGDSDIDGDGVSNINDNCVFMPNPSQADNNSDSVGDACDTLTSALADLSLNIDVLSEQTPLNIPFDYQITVSNGGPNSTDGIVVTDQLPSQTTFVSSTPSQGGCSGTSLIVCNMGTISSGSTATVTIRVAPTVAGRVTNTANVSIDPTQSSIGDPNILNNKHGVSLDITDSSVTYSITGTVRDINSVGIAGAIISLSGSSTASTTTDTSGTFSFTNVASGGYYTVIPTKYGYIFSPASRTFIELNASEVIDFAATMTIPRTARADFDGDGKTDLSVFRPGDGNWYALGSSGGVQIVNWGVATDKPVPGDYDHDGKADVAVFRPSTGQWFVLRSSDSTIDSVSWGAVGDVPVAGDYDGDGKTDEAVYRPSAGQWYVFRSSDGGASISTWGNATDVPIPGDYDGDGKTDVAVYRNGTWLAFQSTAGVLIANWGVGSDKPVPADYDGDNKDDIAVYRPSDGTWYVFRSSDNSVSITTWGNATDVPIPGDYDGDGKTDVAVFREGSWFAYQSTAGVLIANWGTTGDIPIPAKYIP